MNKHKPKILRIINRLNLGGPTYNACYLTKYLEDEFETLLVAGMKDESEASSEFIAEDLGIKPKYIKNMYRSLHPVKDFNAYKEIRSIIKLFKPDIVHTHASKAGAVGRLAALHENVPVIVHTFHGHVFHSYFGKLKTNVFLAIERYLGRKSTKIIAISKKQKQELTEEFNIAPLNNFEIIPLGFDLSRFQKNVEANRKSFRNTYKIADDEICVAIIGRLVPIKNHSFFVKAFNKILAKTNKKAKAIVVGDGELLQEIKDSLTSQNLSFTYKTGFTGKEDVILTSWIKNIEWVLAGVDVVALTSLNEGTPVSLIEAQAAGKPVVSTLVGGVEDVVLDKHSGFLSALNNPKAFESNLLNLINNAKVRAEMGANGIQHVNDLYGLKRLIEDYKAFYKKLLNSN